MITLRRHQRREYSVSMSFWVIFIKWVHWSDVQFAKTKTFQRIFWCICLYPFIALVNLCPILSQLQERLANVKVFSTLLMLTALLHKSSKTKQEVGRIIHAKVRQQNWHSTIWTNSGKRCESPVSNQREKNCCTSYNMKTWQKSASLSSEYSFRWESIHKSGKWFLWIYSKMNFSATRNNFCSLQTTNKIACFSNSPTIRLYNSFSICP